MPYLAMPPFRVAGLMGANSRTSKFALGDALLELTASGRLQLEIMPQRAQEQLSLGLARNIAVDYVAYFIHS
jgi:hypothetical protein